MAGEERERDEALARAIQALARRDHSTRSLRARLERAGVSREAQVEAVEVLERVGYLDDERFALNRASLLARRGYGDERIRADLDAQGVAAESIEVALAGLEPERARAIQVAGSSGADARTLRLLERRGFSADVVELVAANRLHATGDEE